MDCLVSPAFCRDAVLHLQRNAEGGGQAYGCAAGFRTAAGCAALRGLAAGTDEKETVFAREMYRRTSEYLYEHLNGIRKIWFKYIKFFC